MTHALHWFRTDLRVTDNTALQAAMRKADQLTAVFITTPDTWKEHHCSPRKVQFILENLHALSTNLAKQSIPLIISEQSTYMDSITTLIQICDEYKIDSVYFNKQYELDETLRDEQVINALTSLGIDCYTPDDQAIVPPGKILNLSGEPYKVFTPFKKAWLREVTENFSHYQPTTAPNKKFIAHKIIATNRPPKTIQGYEPIKLDSDFSPGENNAQKQLGTFCQHHLKHYYQQRDLPSQPGTSKLSPALTSGTLSARQCLQAIAKRTRGNLSDDKQFPGELTWLSELIWRDFYKHILFHHPDLCRHKPYKRITDKLPWRDDADLLRAWQQGKTGFPLVDAAMRQLNQTGWMHNRLRMITAMFLTKTLFLDWRLGEKYFMEQLIDGDFAANNGGWQWCASTGTDAVPYFRIFNPTTQSERFDKEGTFIRQYCPELRSLNNKQIHNPIDNGVDIKSLGYPAPIVDYKAMRAYVIAQFKHIRD